MADIDPNEPPLFELEERPEPDVEGDDSKGGLVLEGVDIPFELLEFGNGRLPDSALDRIGIGGHRLHRSAAAAFNRWRDAARGAGIDLTLTDSYRNFDQQVDLKRRKPTLSATPGKSVHGWGFAVDLSIGMPPKPFGQSVYRWLQDNGPGIGWHLGRPKDEPWHWVYRGSQDGASVTTSTSTSTSASAELVLGASGERVVALQQALGITADGDFGPQTEAAVKAFQQRSGLEADGRVGPKTWAKVLAVSAPADRPELRIGSSGEPVRWLQQRLTIAVDGDFGSQTDGAVKSFQRAGGLTDDGVVGPKTWAALVG